MSTHANLGYSHIEQNQSGKDVSANAMADRIADALTDDFTQAVTGSAELPFYPAWGGWLSILAFAAIAWVLIRIPARRQ